MNNNEDVNYETLLSTIVNARLIYNTIEEYENKLDIHSLHNNGVRRCFNTNQKLKTAYRFFQVETRNLTHEELDLDEVLFDYSNAWQFYKKNLSRRRNPEELINDLLNYYYPPFRSDSLTTSKKELFDKIVDNDINVPILILLMLKVLPGFDSKDGNLYSISSHYARVLEILETFTKGNIFFSVFPSIIQAREEIHKSRITLIYYTQLILNMYVSYLDSQSLYEQTSLIKQKSIDLDLEGYWNQCSGTLDSTIFWQLEHALNDGTYFVTYWHKDADNRITGIRYTMYLCESADRKLMAYILHPQAVKHRIKGLPYTDKDNVWYKMDMPTKIAPTNLLFERMMSSDFWPNTFNIQRVESNLVIETYDKWLKSCDKYIKFKEFEYLFIPNLYAATIDALYIPKDDDHYYKVPRDAYPGLENVQLDDLAGIMTMGSKEYIVFDELLLYIETSKEQLSKYNIEIVDSIK